ncbi:OadG family protein [Mangrovimonas sp. AS39]|uniref:OadG family protein n=1 Tax=Mangrovimonas TaxID=1211036 RepID=UPI0006B52877|nr:MULTISPECIES: OadG family protein [Mangrovimonas]MCF1191595.1 OadG family protein [Mangrovimonas futianensis]MCF1195517.1 OadG family protein [Mangrovimonas futianensis]MCF1421878.1 OadG family protein [Mangrovimonas futianensis]NIK91977.1 hypothetical protein [Mangrovimonas sp. CR14]
MTLNSIPPPVFLIEQSSIVMLLSISVVFFLILLILGIRKSYKLKKENERLANKSQLSSTEDNKTYKDFTDGHLYE